MRALVTGGSRGIGKAISAALATAGYDLTILAKTEENLATAKRDLQDLGGVVDTIICDLADNDAITRMLCEYKFDVPNVLVLCAGTFIEGSLLELDTKDLETTLQVNLVSMYRIVRHFASSMAKVDFPRIFLIGSTASLEPYKYGPFYGISKWAVRGLACNLRSELMPFGIGVTLINPGGTLTDLWAAEDLPRDRLLAPSDIGKLLCAMLTLSPQAVVEEVVIRPLLGDMHD
jgi:short-subunit dehydrogenase